MKQEPNNDNAVHAPLVDGGLEEYVLPPGTTIRRSTYLRITPDGGGFTKLEGWVVSSELLGDFELIFEVEDKEEAIYKACKWFEKKGYYKLL